MNRPLVRVLIVDDDEDDFFITKELFNEIPVQNLVVEWAPTFQKGIESYINEKHDIYFVDYLLGAKSGIDFLMEAKTSGIKNPIIMLTGKGDQQVDKQAMVYGAADYLIKGELDAEKLERTLRYVLERFIASRKLEESEAKYRSIFEKSRDMIFIADAAGKFIDSNDSAHRILDYSRNELIGKYIFDLFENEKDKLLFREMIAQKTEVADYEKVLYSKNGIKKNCLITTIFQTDSENKVIIQGVIHDITKRRKAENDLATAEKLAVTGRVVRMIGHEIRNPLTNINLSLEQLESEIKGNAELDIYFDIIRRNSDRINTLIVELLNSSKPAQLKIGKVSINTIAQEAINLIHDRIVLKEVELITRFSSDICDISVDQEKVKIALLNILVNAIEAMDDVGG
nr:PAS domain S-box protein [Bacteroidia bacterium]